MLRRLGPLLLSSFALVACDPDASGSSSSGSAATSASSAPTASPSGSSSSTAAIADQKYELDDLPDLDLMSRNIEDQRVEMLKRMRAVGSIDDKQSDAILAILDASKIANQGWPEITDHPMTRRECVDKRAAAGIKDEKKPICKAAYMVPIWDPKKETEDQAKVCIDRYEFPGIPCDYPLVWITTQQAEDVCKVMGKRLCDAHEWEGACAGAVHAPEDEYAFNMPRQTMRGLHNIHREMIWAYGPKQDHSKCGTSSHKSKECILTGLKCGSNTFPDGAFPECKSTFGVYDQHGNAAEHMLLPLHEKDLGSKGGMGEPEMKGSWFIFRGTPTVHEDDCRWRAPSWHEEDGKGHKNYHLGFRCCKDLGG